MNRKISREEHRKKMVLRKTERGKRISSTPFIPTSKYDPKVEDEKHKNKTLRGTE